MSGSVEKFMKFISPSADRHRDFLVENFENPVSLIKRTDVDDNSYMKIHKDLITMQNGATYEVTSTLAKQRNIDIGFVATAAWLTHDMGINRDRMKRAAKLGIDSVFISPQQNLDRFGNFGKNVTNILYIADYLNAHQGRDQQHIMVDGISRGAMHGLGVTAKAPHLDTEVIYGDYTVPCFPDGFDAKRDLPMLPELLMNEAGAATSFIKLPLNAMYTYPRTIAFHPRMLFQHLKEAPALLSGDTGYYAKNMPEDTFGHVTNYLGDIMGQGRRWQPILDEYPNLIVDNQIGGGHLSIAAPECQEDWQRRVEAVHYVIESYPNIINLGSTALKQAVLDYAPAVFIPHRIAA